MDSSMIVLVLVAASLLILLAAVARFSKPRLNKQHFQKHWYKIESENNTTVALIAADSLVDQALQHAGIRGSTMGERLNNAAGLLSDIDGIWRAHKLRNRVVHEPGTEVSRAESERALRKFKRVLKDLRAL